MKSKASTAPPEPQDLVAQPAAAVNTDVAQPLSGRSSESVQEHGSFFGRLLTKRHFLAQRAAIVLIVATAAFVGIPPLAKALASDEQLPPKREMAAIPVQITPATPVSQYEVRKPYTGALVAGRRSRLGFERAGKLIQLEVDEGQSVQAGQLLAKLDNRRLSATRRQVVAELAEAKAVLAELVEGPRKESIAAAEAEVRSLSAQRDVAERNLKRRRSLVETAAISREEYDESLYAVRAANARVDAAQKVLEELETGTRVERVDAQSARVDALAARLADVDHELEDTLLLAPFAGTIARRRLDEGAIVAAGEPVLDLIEDNRLEAWVGVPVESATRLQVGHEAPLVIGDRKYQARVRSLRPELDPATRTRNVVLSVDPNQNGHLVAGQVARVLLTETVQQQGFWVPAGALTPHQRGLWAVYVADGQGPKRTVAIRDVELLHTEGGRSFVRGTLQAGDAIIIAGGHKIVAGQQVAVRQ